MPFQFTWLCELFENLHKNKHLQYTSWSKVQNPDEATIRSWFNKYDGKIARHGPAAVALLSALFPERRVDRVYNVQENRLSTVLGRALGLGHSRAEELNRWRRRNGEEIAICVERIMAQCEFDPPAPGRQVTLEEIDAALHQLAANSPFSSPDCRAAATSATVHETLTPIIRRLQSFEAKWFIGMLLKSYPGIQIPESLVLHEFHFMLRHLLAVQNSFMAAVNMLGSPNIITLPARPSSAYERALRPLLAKEVVPEVGVMISRQPYYKARSIKHCCQMVDMRHMSVERKYDGEYCQIHIDLSKGHQCIQIFSKSGKNSTQDRSGVHQAIKDGLRIGRDDCTIRKRCIVEGELLVWSSRRRCILPFHKIRKYARHGGRRLGCAADSPLRSDENLMIAVYDMLLLDDKILMSQGHAVRRHYLENNSTPVQGKFLLGERQIIDFSTTKAAKTLRETFANAISACWEGLVLKPCDEAYHSWETQTYGIKLKKDYIAGMGNSADLCIVGGRRDAKVEKWLNVGPLQWTSFYLGCLTNKPDVQRYNKQPRIRIIDELTHHSMPKSELVYLNKLGSFRSTPFSRDNVRSWIELGRKDLKVPSELFTEPFVVEMLGAGFEKPSNCAFYTLRFPRTTAGAIKLHLDRSITDTTDFAELQLMAQESIEPNTNPASTEDAQWIRLLLEAEGRSRSTRDTSELRSPGSSSLLSPSKVHQTARRRTTKQQPVSIHIDTDQTQSHSKRNPGSLSPPAALTRDVSPQSSVRSDNTYSRGLKRARDVLGDLSSFNAKRLNCRTGHVDAALKDWEISETTTGENDLIATTPNINSQIFSPACIPVDESYKPVNASCRVPIGNDTTSTTIASDKLTLDGTENTSGHGSLVTNASVSQLLTPPSSGELNGRLSLAACRPPTAAVSQQPRPVKFGASAVQSEHERLIPERASFIEPDIIGPVWIPPSVSEQEQVRVRLYRDLAGLDLLYTSVPEAFVNSLERINKGNQQRQEKRRYHIVVLDFNQPEKAKTDLDCLFQHLLRRSNLVTDAEDSENKVKQKARAKLWFEARFMIWDYSLFSRWKLYLSSHSECKIGGDDNRDNASNNNNPNPHPSDTKSVKNGDPLPSKINLRMLSQFCQSKSEEAELFAGFMRIHSRTFLEKGTMRYFLAQDWTWLEQ